MNNKLYTSVIGISLSTLYIIFFKFDLHGQLFVKKNISSSYQGYNINDYNILYYTSYYFDNFVALFYINILFKCTTLI